MSQKYIANDKIILNKESDKFDMKQQLDVEI